MNIHDIRGWSAGGRRPITHNLRPGQFRGLGSMSIFGTPTKTVVNNYYDQGMYNGYQDNTPKWITWAMGGGMLMNFVGQMLQAIFPHSGGVDGRGSANENETLALCMQLTKGKGDIGGPFNGKYTFTPKNGTARVFENLEALNNYVMANFTDNAENNVQTARTEASPNEPDATAEQLSSVDEHQNTDETPSNQMTDAAEQPQGNDEPLTIKTNGKVWYNIVQEKYKGLKGQPYAVIMQVVHAVKDATNKDVYGVGNRYNNKIMPTEIKLPKNVTVNVRGQEKTFTLNQE